ncbi:PemK-like, MazF-like toxin of type II toxin-antitoxin system [Caprobacter fermentans]|uniref:PemK-like, MazF-like toxin of type II toxin-antitoxin system n=1 Tax=Caproicibacter fermentans TaxID=2576756 RepID=A0A6N8I1W7_9FIRM|nr:PemK-like, MazF-like toxin of type II toxin-antitoxin system [Caproicibacter fermentans]QNK39816.1 type II toxin-antitoxin system PemK/MazF family toxin [Caproicibacter fermentans]
MNISRGDVFYADLMPVIGCEQGGIRPVLIIQNNIGNRYSPTVIVAAITSRMEKISLPTHVPLTGEHIGLRQHSIVMLEQIRTIDRSRLRAYLGRIGGECLRSVDEALGVSLGLFIRQAESKEEQYETSMALLPHRRAGGSKRRAKEAGKAAL